MLPIFFDDGHGVFYFLFYLRLLLRRLSFPLTSQALDPRCFQRDFDVRWILWKGCFFGLQISFSAS